MRRPWLCHGRAQDGIRSRNKMTFLVSSNIGVVQLIQYIRVRPALPVIAGSFVKRMPDIGFRYAVRQRGIATGSSWSSSSVLLFFIACHRSQSSCNPSQKSADVRKTRASRSAVSGVTERLARIISLRRGKDTPRRTANSDCVMPSGFRNSSSSISPGCDGYRSTCRLYTAKRSAPCSQNRHPGSR